MLEQTYGHFEVILLDDASTDNSTKIISSFQSHPKVSKVILNKSNSGSVFKQWIKGIAEAKGDYIWIAESDDFAHKTFLEETVNILNRNDAIGMVFTDSIKVNEDNEELGLISESKTIIAQQGNKEFIVNKENCALYLLETLIIVNASSVLFRKDAINAIDTDKLEHFQNLGDVYTYVSIALNYDISYHSKPLNYMRLHNKNTTKTNKKSGILYKDQIYLLDEIMSHFVDHDISKQGLLKYYVSLFFFSIDFGYKAAINELTQKLYTLKFIKRHTFQQIKLIIRLYSLTTISGRPYALRQYYKKQLFRSLHLNGDK